ncbi:hypothetical protein T11_10458 [Trichinella zimbabwensis]|uniref:Uncharacterized protein n=1 Tax=Trichinella zimbabwensis TaxID=268475 RepID=A0A0V1HC00_9BILA|nr:hypothetical protein T11_10458 [Trichinella zimbabwensis]
MARQQSKQTSEEMLICTSKHHWIAQINFKAEVRSNYFITVRRVSLTCKFPCVALPNPMISTNEE